MTTDLVSSFVKAIELILSFNPEVMQITFLSLRISLLAVFYACLFGIPLGVILGSNEFFGKRFVLTLVNTGMSFPPVVMGLLIFVLFSINGPFGQIHILLTETAMILAQFLLAFPIMIGLVSSAVKNVDDSLIESAITLGASNSQLIWMEIREIRTDILAAIMTAFGGAISEIGAVLIVGGNIRFKTRTLTTAIGTDIGSGDWQTAFAMGIILLMTAFLVNLVLTFVQHSEMSKYVRGD